MTTQEIANRLVTLCREGNWQQALDELYHDDAESIEPAGTPWASVKGMEAFAKKAKAWAGMIEEYHGNEVSEPLVAGNFFSLCMMTDSTMKHMGHVQFEELIMYEVQDGKIVKEQFFYTPPSKP